MIEPARVAHSPDVSARVPLGVLPEQFTPALTEVDEPEVDRTQRAQVGEEVEPVGGQLRVDLGEPDRPDAGQGGEHLGVRPRRHTIELEVGQLGECAQVGEPRDQGLAEVPGTRLLVATGRLMAEGITAEEACRVALAGPPTDDPDLLAAIADLVAATL